MHAVPNIRKKGISVFKRFIPPAGAPRILATTQLISCIGDGAYYVCVALYFTRIVGFSPALLGGGLTFAWAVALLVGVPIGHLADRYGPRRVAALLAIGAGLAIGSYLFIRSYPLFIIAACVYTVCTRGTATAQQALLAALVDKSQITEIRGYIQSTFNLGLALGAALGGVALLIGSLAAYMTIFSVDALSFLFAALMLTRLRAVAGTVERSPGRSQFTVLRDRPYMLMSVLNAILLLHIPLLDVALPLWIALRTSAPQWVISLLFLLNTITVVLFQTPIARKVTDLASASRFVGIAGTILLASCLAFASSSLGSSAWLATSLLVLAALLQVLGEMIQFSGTWKISFGLAPEGKQGQYQGFFGSGVTVAEMIGPFFLTGLVIYGGPIGWVGLGSAFLAAGFLMGPVVRWAERTSDQRQRVTDRGLPEISPIPTVIANEKTDGN